MNVLPVVLEGTHVRLEPLSPAHFGSLYRELSVDRSVLTHQLDWPDDDSEAAFMRWMETFLTRSLGGGAVAFAIVDRKTGEAVGTTSFLEIRPANRRLEIGGTWIGKRFQGTQVNPEAKFLMLRHAFESQGAFRVELKTSSENLQSQRAIEKLGAKREALLRNYQIRKTGLPRDTVMFGITDEEWPRVKRGLQTRLGMSPRDALVDLLRGHQAADEKERTDLEAMRRYAETLEAPFARTQREAHFTGSAVVVDPNGERVCLIHHGKLHRWLQPGGHADPADEGSMELSALREANEETGCRVVLHPEAPRPLDVDIHVIPARKDEPEHRHLDVRFLVVARNPEALAHDPNESHGAQWLSWDEALGRADEAPLRRMLLKARASTSSA